MNENEPETKTGYVPETDGTLTFEYENGQPVKMTYIDKTGICTSNAKDLDPTNNPDAAIEALKSLFWIIDRIEGEPDTI